MEQWKTIEGFKSRYGKPYHVSSEGRFKNDYGKILSFHPHKKGYLMVQIPKNGKTDARWQAHRLVAKAFIPNPYNLPQVNHKDGDKKNNCVSNLEWCTNLENMQHSWEIGLRVVGTFTGEKNRNSLLTNQQALEIRNAPLRKGPYAEFTRKALAEKYNVTEHVIKDIRNGRSYKGI